MNDHRHADDDDAPHHVHFESPEMAAYAELEGEALASCTTDAVAALAEHCGGLGLDVRRVLDIGCGPGVGTCLLAQRFGAARVVAVDGSAAMLERLANRAERLGLTGRIEARAVELPGDLDTLERADVAWASMVLHHLGDEADALRRIRSLLAPRGLLAVVERGEPLRILPDDVELGRPGIWERLDAAWTAWFTDLRRDLPGSTPSPDYPTMFARAGYELVADDVLTLVLEPPLDVQARRFAHEHLRRTRPRLTPYVAEADLDALDALVDEHAPDGILRRGDAVLRESRHLFVARAA